MGTPYVSSNSKVAYGVEATPGTRAVTIDQELGKTNGDWELPDAEVTMRKYWAFGIGRELKRVQPGPIDRKGKLPLIPSDGRLLGHLWGFDTFTAGTPNTHVLSSVTASSLGRAILPAMSLSALVRDDANARPFQRTFVGTAFEEGSLSCAKEEELQADLGVMSLDVQDEASGDSFSFINPSVDGFTSVAGRPYMWHDSVVTVYGSPIARAEAFQCNWKNNLQAKRYLVDNSGRNPFEYLTGRPEYGFQFDFVPAGFLAAHTGTYQFLSGSQTTRESLYDLLEGGTYGDVRVKLTKPGSPESSIQLDFADCQFSSAKHSLREDGQNIQVPAVVEPRKFTATVKDAIAQYVV